jgi:O-antigen/teichoic acid export membrane protein
VLTRLATRIVIVLLPATVAGAALAGPMMKLLVGGRFLPAANAFAAALAMVPLAPITGAVGAASAIRLRPGARLAATGAGATTFIVAVFVLVPPLGAAGASAAVLAGTIVSALAGTILFPDLLARRSVIAALAVSALVMVNGMVW